MRLLLVTAIVCGLAYWIGGHNVATAAAAPTSCTVSLPAPGAGEPGTIDYDVGFTKCTNGTLSFKLCAQTRVRTTYVDAFCGSFGPYTMKAGFRQLFAGIVGPRVCGQQVRTKLVWKGTTRFSPSTYIPLDTCR